MIIQDIGAKLMGDVVQRRLDMGAETTIKTLHGRRVYITKTGGRRGRRSRRRSKKMPTRMKIIIGEEVSKTIEDFVDSAMCGDDVRLRLWENTQGRIA